MKKLIVDRLIVLPAPKSYKDGLLGKSGNIAVFIKGAEN